MLHAFLLGFLNQFRNPSNQLYSGRLTVKLHRVVIRKRAGGVLPRILNSGGAGTLNRGNRSADVHRYRRENRL